MSRQPFSETCHQRSHVIGTVTQQGGCRHHDIGACQEILDHLIAALDTQCLRPAIQSPVQTEYQSKEAADGFQTGC